MYLISPFLLVASQEIPENGGISDQQFYCGPVGAAFDYNEFILPYVGVAIMFFSVVYSRYGAAAALLFLPFDYIRRVALKPDLPSITYPARFKEHISFFADKSVYSPLGVVFFLFILFISILSLGTSADSAVALGVTGHRRDSELNADERTKKSSSCLPSCCGTRGSTFACLQTKLDTF